DHEIRGHYSLLVAAKMNEDGTGASDCLSSLFDHEMIPRLLILQSELQSYQLLNRDAMVTGDNRLTVTSLTGLTVTATDPTGSVSDLLVLSSGDFAEMHARVFI
ncbi:unnamed protein product, partial [Didymodactylos carnosus]